ncbi:MAG: WD40 repeat domain-containing protein [Bacteroidota bacterium]
MTSKKHTRIFLFLLSLSTSFAPLNGADVDSIHSASDKEASTPPLMEDNSQVVSPPLESQNESEVRNNAFLELMERELRPLIDFFRNYENSPSCMQSSHDQDGKPQKNLYAFSKILEKIEECNNIYQSLYTFSIILLGLPPQQIKSDNLIFLTDMLFKHFKMENYYFKAVLQSHGSKNAEDIYPSDVSFQNNMEKLIGRLKREWKFLPEKSYKIDGRIIGDMAVSPDDTSLLWSENFRDVYLFDINTKESVKFTRHEERIRQLIWSPDGKFFVSTSYSYGFVCFWNKKDGSLIKKLEVAEARLTAMCYSKHNLFVSDCFGNVYVVKKLKEEYTVRKLVANDDKKKEPRGGMVSLPNNCILFSRRKNIWIYDECENKLQYTVEKNIKIRRMEASFNGKYLALTDGKTLEICSWDKKKKELNTKFIQNYPHSFGYISFSHDSRFLFITRPAYGIVIIDILRHRKIEITNCIGQRQILCISFNHCNGFVTVSRNKMISIWKLPLKRMEPLGLVEFIVKRKWRLTIALCAQEIFALITNYAFELDLPFSWVWEK